MKKHTIVLGISLLLNILLVIGFFCFRNYTRSHVFKVLAIKSEGDAKYQRHILSTIESGDTEKIGLLKERLRRTIEAEEWNADALRGVISEKK